MLVVGESADHTSASHAACVLPVPTSGQLAGVRGEPQNLGSPRPYLGNGIPTQTTEHILKNYVHTNPL